ncbi:MAG: linear amide C-N hydrolase [Clostridia bacterium]|nr:linear amide C-N hydrolase [Clostridia bacterium]
MGKTRGKPDKSKRIVLLGVLAVFLVLFGVLWTKFGRFVMAAGSVTWLEADLYSMEFKGDYGFDEFLEKGGASSDEQVGQFFAKYISGGLLTYQGSVNPAPFGCSTFLTQNKAGDILFGRNYDWQNCTVLLVRTTPKNGYASVSTCCMDFMGFGADYRPNNSAMERVKAIAAIYAPLDGMNEKGLIVADLMAGDKEKTAQQTDKPDLTTTTALRLLLDRAATVDEAIELLKQYDMNSSVDFAHHFAIADASGKSVAVEYVNNEMVVTETPVLTNHYLAEQKGKNGGKQSHERFDKLEKFLGKTLEGSEVAAVMETVAQKNYEQPEDDPKVTVWTWVYSPGAKMALFYHRENFAHAFRISILADTWVSEH